MSKLVTEEGEGPSERVDLGSLDDPANVPGTYNQGGSSDIQMISAKPKEIPTQVEGVCEIIPVSGSVEGRYPFNISLTEPLPDDVVSGMAEFEGVETVALTRINPYTFSGLVPASHCPVVVKVTSQCGEFLGRTSFRYVDEMLEMRKQQVQDPAEQFLLFSCMLQEYGSIGTDSDSAQFLVPPNLQFQAVSQDKESNEETSSVESDETSSDYFADTETSCESFEHNGVFTSNSEGKDDTEKDFSGSPEPLVSSSFGNFLTNPSLDDSVDVKTEGPGTRFSDCVFKTQILDEDSVESAVEKICSESDEISGLMGGISCEIAPLRGKSLLLSLGTVRSYLFALVTQAKKHGKVKVASSQGIHPLRRESRIPFRLL